MLRKNKIISYLLVIFLAFIIQGAHAKNPISINANDNASLIKQDIPSSLSPGQVYTVTITMRNNGDTRWTKAENYRLELYDQIDNMYQSDVWGIRSAALPYDASPSDEITFIFSITAPLTGGYYNCRWSMAKEKTYFGEITPAILLNVGGSTYNPVTYSNTENTAQFVDQAIPSAMQAGQSYKVWVTMRNTGSESWSPAGDYMLTSLIDPVDMRTYWNPASVHLSQTVDPGQTSTIEFYLTAPQQSGVYNMQWSMSRRGILIGEKSGTVAVNVTGGSPPPPPPKPISLDHSTIVDQKLPDLMYVNKTYPVTVTLKNTGTTTWEKGKHHISVVDPKVPPVNVNPWNVGFVSIPYDVAPGYPVSVTFDVKAPSVPGWYKFQINMMDGNNMLIDSPGSAIDVYVGDEHQ